MLKIDLKLQIMNQIGHCLKEKNEKIIELTKDELGRKIIKFVGLRAKAYSHSIDDGSEDKKQKVEKCVL